MQKEHLYIASAGIISGFYLVGTRIMGNLGLSVIQISLFGALFTLAILLPFVLFRKKLKLKKEMIPFFILFGLVTALSALFQYGSILLGTPVAAAILLIYTQPIWTAVINRFWLKESFNHRKLLAVILVFIGAAILVNPLTISSMPIPGLIFAFLGGIGFAVWIIMSRIAGKRKYEGVTTKFGYTIFMVPFFLLMLPFSLIIYKPSIFSLSFNIPWYAWLLLFAFETLVNTIGAILIIKGTQKISAIDSSIILLIEPLSAAILSFLILRQPLAWNILIGGIFIVAGNYFVLKK